MNGGTVDLGLYGGIALGSFSLLRYNRFNLLTAKMSGLDVLGIGMSAGQSNFSVSYYGGIHVDRYAIGTP